MAEKEMGKWLVALLIVGIVGYALYQGGYLQQQETAQVPPQEIRQVVTEKKTVTPSGETLKPGLPIETLKGSVKNKFTMADIQDVQIQFWKVGADPSDPNQAPLDYATTDSSGIWSTTNMVLQTGTNYDVYFNGSSTYYDELIDSWQITYNPDTGKGYFLVNGESYYPAVPFGAFVSVDSLAENSSSVVSAKTNVTDETITWTSTWVSLAHDELYSGYETVRNSTGELLTKDTDYSINYATGQIKNLTTAVTSTAKINYTYAPDNTIAYDESVGTGSFWFKLDIGNANANSELHDVVMCIRDSDGDLEGDEVTGYTASFVSGSTAISIPGDLLGYWTDGVGAGGKRCIAIASKLGSAEKARWQFDITVSEANWAEKAYTNSDPEDWEVTFDDLGDYAEKQYPSGDVKATAETLTIACQA